MKGLKLQNWIVRFLSVLFILNSFLPLYAEFDAKKVAEAASSADGIVICTADGLKLISLADGAKKDLPTNSSHKSSCPFYLISSGHSKISQVDSLPEITVSYEKLSYSGESFSLHSTNYFSHKSPRAPPYSLS